MYARTSQNSTLREQGIYAIALAWYMYIGLVGELFDL